MKKLAMVLALLVLAAFAIAGCGASDGGNGGTQTGNGGGDGDGGGSDVGGDTFTLAELAEFDGRDGSPAYVAVDGVIYDVSGSDEWPEGDHIPCELDAAAGKDLSEVLRRAPARMRALIEAMPVVGTLSP